MLISGHRQQRTLVRLPRSSEYRTALRPRVAENVHVFVPGYTDHVADMDKDTRANPPGLTPEMIEGFRQTGIRLDRQGRLWHQGAEIAHPGLKRALLRWMDRLDDGRPILRLDQQRYAYLDVEDAHLLVTSARWQDDRALVTLNEGSEQELEYESLQRAEDNALYCTVRGGKLDARVTTPAYYVLAERIAPSPSRDSAFVLRAAGREFAIGRRAA
jgi:uncharacterized protein